MDDDASASSPLPSAFLESFKNPKRYPSDSDSDTETNSIPPDISPEEEERPAFVSGLLASQRGLLNHLQNIKAKFEQAKFELATASPVLTQWDEVDLTDATTLDHLDGFRNNLWAELEKTLALRDKSEEGSRNYFHTVIQNKMKAIEEIDLKLMNALLAQASKPL